MVCGIRPEHFVVAGEGGVATRIEVLEPTGSETIALLLAPGAVDAQICVVLRERMSLKAGEEVHLAPRPEAIHILDKATGKTLAA